ncbi:response regulator [Oscillatoriales cyanobacterium LEGE 11467]|uniref:Response regulator n=1 Tax=Zarconia navalis LEGE 11467 TaxID=1828826 RepID=A0A928VY01_9CYAN|nr:response regulator [Zarconia navalis]MBE9041358.1 response regulator [Zarconia navalis LEGE 11467]
MRSILIAEDESRIAAFLEKGLQQNGYRPKIAADGAQALQYLDLENFDLLILDIGLPILDGWEVLKQLRDRKKSVSVILITACDEAREKVPEFSDIVDDFLPKPFRFKHLLASVRHCLTTKHELVERLSHKVHQLQYF